MTSPKSIGPAKSACTLVYGDVGFGQEYSSDLMGSLEAATYKLQFLTIFPMSASTEGQ